MQRSILWLVPLLFVVPLQAQTLSYADCVDAALNNNPMIDASQARIAQANAALAQAKNGRLPSLDFSYNAMYSNQPLNVFGAKLSQSNATFSDLGTGEFTGSNIDHAPDALNRPDAIANFNTRLQLNIPIYNGGVASAARDEAQHIVLSAQHGDTAARQKLQFMVLEAYEGVHATTAYLKVAEEATKASQSLVKNTKALILQGLLVRSEGLSAEVYLAGRNVDLAKARNQYSLAIERLKMLMALQINDELEIGPAVELKAMNNMSESALSELAVASNPQIQAMQEQLSATQSKVDGQRSNLKPSFNMMVRNEWNDENPVGFGASAYTVGGELKWRVFDFSASRRGVDRVAAQRVEVLAQLNQQKAQLRLQIRTSWLMLNEAQERVALRELSVTQAEEARSLVGKRYKNGLATLVEVLMSQTQLDKSRADLVIARYEKKMHLARLYLNSGQFNVHNIISGVHS